MSVSSALLAVLEMGPGYGSQLQAEVLTRATHRRQLNAGQVYATLDRLVEQGKAAPAGTTDDGLPLYALTPAGHAEAHEWLSSAVSTVRPDWDEMLDQVLVSASILAADPLAVIMDYELAWREQIRALGGDHAAPLESAASAAATLRAEAALSWLTRIRSTLVDHRDAYTLVRSAARPRRGRPAAK